MINQPRKKIKSLNNIFMQADLVDLYNSAVKKVISRESSILLACCNLITAISFILYGTYKRNVIDVVLVVTPERKPFYQVRPISLRIQRIKCKSKLNKCKNNTHALLFDFFVPYGHYSVRFILHFLKLYFDSDKSIEAFCLEEGPRLFSEKTFKKWLAWYDTHIELFHVMGIVSSPKQKREIRKTCFKQMITDIAAIIRNSLHTFNFTIFQRHKSPKNTHYSASNQILDTV
jgi:hypothetical protein